MPKKPRFDACNVLSSMRNIDPVHYFTTFLFFLNAAYTTGDTGLIFKVLDNFYGIYRSDSAATTTILTKEAIGAFLHAYKDLLLKMKTSVKRCVMDRAVALSKEQGGKNRLYRRHRSGG